MKRDDTRYKGIYDAGYEAGRDESPPWDGRVKLLVGMSIGFALCTVNAFLNDSLYAGFLLLSAVVCVVGALNVWPRR